MQQVKLKLFFLLVLLSLLFPYFRLLPHSLVGKEGLVNSFKALLSIFEASSQSTPYINIKLVIYDIKYLIRISYHHYISIALSRPCLYF
jgi:hypothetical protein